MSPECETAIKDAMGRLLTWLPVRSMDGFGEDLALYNLAMLSSTKEEFAEQQAHLRNASQQAGEYHRVMGLLGDAKLPHGSCEPREARACTHCNAVEDLEVMRRTWIGPRTAHVGAVVPGVPS